MSENSLNIVKDYLIPWYILSPHDPYAEAKPVDILKFNNGIQIMFHTETLKKYHDDDDHDDDSLKILLETAFKYHSSIGLEVLSWIYSKKCCFSNSNDIDEAHHLADQLGIQDLRYAILYSSLRQTSSLNSMPIICTFESAKLEYRNEEKFKLGIHVAQENSFLFEHNVQNVYVVRQIRPVEEITNSFYQFLVYIHDITNNSRELYRMIHHANNDKMQNVFMSKPNQFRLQILTDTYDGIKEAIAGITEEVVFSFTVDYPSFFFDMDDIQPYFTISSPFYNGLLKFMRNYINCSSKAAKRYALEIRKPDLRTVKRLMGVVKELGFYALENVFYVLDWEAQRTLDMMEKLEESKPPCLPQNHIKLVEVPDLKPLPGSRSTGYL